MSVARKAADNPVAKGSLWNVSGLGVTLIAAILAVPSVVHGLGLERFGLLALAWAIVGAASMLDLGIGRALIQALASRKASGATADVPALAWTATIGLAAFGAIIAALLIVAAPWLANEMFHVGPALSQDAQRAIVLLGCGVPFALASSALQGVLEAHLRFDLSNLVRVPLSVSNYLIPLGILPFTTDLAWIVAGLVMARVLGFAAYAALARKILAREAARKGHLRMDLLGPLLSLAGWMTVSNIVATTIIYLDRFIIGARASMSAVAFYATPYELVIRLSVLPGAIGSALLPVFSSLSGAGQEETERVFSRGLRYIVLLVFPAAMLIALFAHEGLAFWLSEQFAQASTRIAQILAVGVFVNSLAIVPIILLYGSGRADSVARLHLLELPAYAIVLWELVGRFGAEGAALAWTLRVVVDALLLFAIVRRRYPNHDFRYRRVATAIVLGVAALLIGMVLQGVIVRVVYALVTLVAFASYAWARLLAHRRTALKLRT